MRSRQAARSIVAVTLTGAITVFGASGADATAPQVGPLDDEPVQADPADLAVVPTLLTGVLDLAGALVGSLVPAPPEVAPSSPPSLRGVAPADLSTRSVTAPLAAAPVGAPALSAQTSPVPPSPVDCPEPPLSPAASMPSRTLPPMGGPTTAVPRGGTPQVLGVLQPAPAALTADGSVPDPCAVPTAPSILQLPQQLPQQPRQLPQLPQRTLPPMGSTQAASDDRDDDRRSRGDDSSRSSDRSDDRPDGPSDDESDGASDDE
jgi:hypothetical protein